MSDCDTRKCFICHETKDLEEFYPNKSRKSGREHYCKACNTTRMREYNQRRSVKSRKDSTTALYKRFTPAEDALVMDYSLSAVQVAEKLGRTYYSVQNRRAYLSKSRGTQR